MSVLDFDYYEGKDLLANAPSKPYRPKLSLNPSAAQAREYADNLESYERRVEIYNEYIRDYNEKIHYRQNVALKNELMSDYDLSYPQFDVLWSYAYQKAHSEGLRRVVEEFIELYEIATLFVDVTPKR